MKTLNQLIKASEDAVSLLKKMQAVRDKFRADAAPIAGNPKLHPDHIRETIKDLQDAALSQFGAPMNTLNSLISSVNSDVVFWRSVPFFLSRQKFHADDPVLENATRLRYALELGKVPGGLLSLTFLDAVSEKNWALAFAAWTEGDVRDKMPPGIDLASVPPIAEQRQGLALIAKILATTGVAHALVAEVSGRRVHNLLDQARSQVPEDIAVSLNFEQPPSERKPPDVVVQQVGTPSERLAAHRATVGAPE